MISLLPIASCLTAIEKLEPMRSVKEEDALFKMYPKTVPIFDVRIDPITKAPVSRGRWELIKTKRLTVQQFKDALQCDVMEPALDDYYGTMSLMLLFPPTKDSVELMCTWAETRCKTWKQCRELRDMLKIGTMENLKTRFGMDNFNMLESFRMFRIINGALHWDWPWGMERIPKLEVLSSIHSLLILLLHRVTDLKDSVFFLGGEFPVFPDRFPFPLIAQAGNLFTNTILWPWESETRKEIYIHNEIVEQHDSIFSNKNMRTVTKTREWEKKDPRCAFFASPDFKREVLFEQAARHPDLFLLHQGFMEPLPCWDPACTVEGWSYKELHQMTDEYLNSSTLSGLPRFTNLRSNTPTTYEPGKFKFVIVPEGMGGVSTSSRLLNVLGHCECVVFLVNSALQFHFSGKLVPWVHYVPLSTIGADVVSKLRYLRANDHLAKQIAINAKNFATSYLRFEDYMCYSATLFDTLGTVMANTTALQPFTPINVHHAQLDLLRGGYGGYR